MIVLLVTTHNMKHNSHGGCLTQLIIKTRFFLRSNINIGPVLISMGCLYPIPFMRKIILTRRTITLHRWM